MHYRNGREAKELTPYHLVPRNPDPPPDRYLES